MTGQDGQSIFDICIQGGYKIEDIYDLIVSNNINNINELSFNGKEIIFNPELVNNFNFKNTILLTGELTQLYNPPIVETYYRITSNGSRRKTTSGDLRIHG